MKTLLRFLFMLMPVLAFGQPSEATLLGHWADPAIVPAFFDNPYHDVWGAVVNDKEIGIVTSTNGFHFFDLSDDASAFEPTAFIGGTATGSNISHRDAKTYLHYLYAVADEGPSALQVVDMSGLPDSVELVYESNEFVTTAHNIFIDEDNARLYIAGGNGFNLRILSLEDPENPTLLASFPNAELDLPYIHDLFVQDNIAYLHAGWEGFGIIDFNDPDAPVTLGTLESYQNQGYNHSGWISEDGNYYYMLDETHGADIKIIDISDPEDIFVVSRTNAGSTPNQIAHNAIVQGNLLYTSYYYDGLQVFDVSKPEYPRRVVEYDTYDGPNTSYFAGAWGIFVLPSGRSLISDMNNGFYFFDVIDLPANYSVTPNVGFIQACAGITSTFNILIGDEFADTGVSLSTNELPVDIEVTFSTTNAQPGEEVEVTVSATSGNFFDLIITATDGTNERQSQLPILIEDIPPGATLQVPQNERTDVKLSPLFLWMEDDDAFFSQLQISTDSLDFENHLVFDEPVNGSGLFLPIDLEEGTQYFWRIVNTFTCGESFSTIFTFTTETITSIRDLGGNTFNLYPNPASQEVNLVFERGLSQRLQADLFSLDGKKLRTAFMPPGATHLEIAISDLPNGVYTLRMTSDGNSAARRIMVQR